MDNVKLQLSVRILFNAILGLGFLARVFQQIETVNNLMSEFALAYCFIFSNLTLYFTELVFKLYYKKMLEPYNY